MVASEAAAPPIEHAYVRAHKHSYLRACESVRRRGYAYVNRQISNNDRVGHLKSYNLREHVVRYRCTRTKYEGGPIST